jgi:predicted nucleic-acid-binding Zn-ribbon protein
MRWINCKCKSCGHEGEKVGFIVCPSAHEIECARRTGTDPVSLYRDQCPKCKSADVVDLPLEPEGGYSKIPGIRERQLRPLGHAFCRRCKALFTQGRRVVTRGLCPKCRRSPHG